MSSTYLGRIDEVHVFDVTCDFPACTATYQGDHYDAVTRDGWTVAQPGDNLRNHCPQHARYPVTDPAGTLFEAV